MHFTLNQDQVWGHFQEIALLWIAFSSYGISSWQQCCEYFFPRDCWFCPVWGSLRKLSVLIILFSCSKVVPEDLPWILNFNLLMLNIEGPFPNCQSVGGTVIWARLSPFYWVLRVAGEETLLHIFMSPLFAVLCLQLPQNWALLG